MKKLILIIVVCSFASLGFGQNIIEKHFSDYKDKDDVTSISITGKMFQIASQIELEIEGKDTEHLQDMVSRIESFNMIVAENMPQAKSAYTNGISKVQNTHEELMRINNKEGNFMIKIDEYGGLVREVIMIGQSDDKFIAFSLMGSIQLDELGEVVGEIQAHGLDDIEDIFDNKIDEFKVYPNPSKSNNTITIDIPNSMIGGKVMVSDLDGKLLDTINASDNKQSVNTSKYRNGSYIIQLVKGDVHLSKKLIILD